MEAKIVRYIYTRIRPFLFYYGGNFFFAIYGYVILDFFNKLHYIYPYIIKIFVLNVVFGYCVSYCIEKKIFLNRET